MNASAACVLLLVALFIAKPTRAGDGVLIHGPNYDGIIVTPGMLKEFGQYPPGNMFNTGVWVPSLGLVRQAEARLPNAIVANTPPPKIVATYYVPQYFAPKQGTPHASPGHERLEDNITDSAEDNSFLYDAAPHLKEYKREYLGVTVNGRKFILLQFVNPWVLSDDEGKKEYLHGWEAILDGGDLVWSAQYDPATGKFSDWEE